MTPTAGGGVGDLTSPIHVENDNNLLNAHAVVTETLVCVDDVEDLQRKNTYLVATVRSLTDELESRGNSELSKAGRDGGTGGGGGATAIGVDVAVLVAEVADMREARGRQEELVAAIVRQRDMYRIAAQAANVSGGRSASSPIPGTHGGGGDSGGMGSPGASLAAYGGGGASGMGSSVSPSQLAPSKQRAMMDAAQFTAAEQAAAAAAQVESALRQQVSELERNLARAGGERDMLRQVCVGV